MPDVDDLSPRMCRQWQSLLLAAEDNRLRRTDKGAIIYDPPSGPTGLPIRASVPAAQLVGAGLNADWLVLDAGRYRRTPDGDAALERIQARLGGDVTVRPCR